MPADGPAPAGASLYSDHFYDEISPASRDTARVVVPMLVDLLHPSSIVDVGCGVGAWLAVCLEHGIDDVLGIDGSYVQREQLQIPVAQFREADLEQPPAVDRTFDVALSLEVAEHLPASAADRFVAYLTSLAPVVLFSAATPGQGGIGHVNEQWPGYWSERFHHHGYDVYDVVRPRIWSEPGVAGYFAQNLLLYASDDRLATAGPTFPTTTGPAGDRQPLALVHPGVFDEAMSWRDRPRPAPSLQSLVRQLPGATRDALRRRLASRRDG